MDDDAREISVWLSVLFCLQSYGIERVARLFDLSGYIASSSEKMLGARRVCLLQGPAHAVSHALSELTTRLPTRS